MLTFPSVAKYSRDQAGKLSLNIQGLQMLSRYKHHLLFLFFLLVLWALDELAFNSEDTVPVLLQVYVVLDLARVLESNGTGMKVGNQEVQEIAARMVKSLENAPERSFPFSS